MSRAADLEINFILALPAEFRGRPSGEREQHGAIHLDELLFLLARDTSVRADLAGFGRV